MIFKMIEGKYTPPEFGTFKSTWISASIPRHLVCLILVFIPVSALGEMRFEDVSRRAGVFNHSPTAASAWGDFNNDGWPDLWVSNHLGRPPSLYLNRKDGTFINIAEKVLSDYVGADFHGAAWADFDNDGDQDLIVLTGGGGGRGTAPNFFFVNEDGKLINKAKDLGLDYPLGRGRTPLWIDANRDGKLDVLLMNHPRAEAPSAIFLQTPMGFVERSQELGFRNLPPSRIENALARITRLMRFRWPEEPRKISTPAEFAQLADISGSNELELVAYNMWYTRIFSVNDAHFREITNDIVLPDVSFVQDAALEDFNGDGQIDWYLARAHWGPDVTQTNPSSLQGELQSSPKDSKAVRFRTEGEVTFGIYSPWRDPTDPARDTKPQLFIGSKRLELTDPIITISPNNPTVREPAPAVTTIGESISIEFDPKSKVWTFKSSVQRIGFVITSTKPIDSIQHEGFKPSKGDLPDMLMIRDKNDFVARRQEVANAACGSVAAGDFDNDGDVDLYLECTELTKNAPNILLENDGNGNFVKVPNAGGAEGSRQGRGNQVVTADFDRDGFLDLFVTNGGAGLSLFDDEGPHQLFRNLGNANKWLEIDLEGVVSNRDGIGAKVILDTGGKVQIRQQDGGMHSFSQDHARIHFGLGPHKKVDRLTIYWPSGAVQHLGDVQANQILFVREQP